MQVTCNLFKKNKKTLVNVRDFKYPERKVLEDSVPWIVRQNPDSFPFLLPANVSSELVGGVVKKYGTLHWNAIC